MENIVLCGKLKSVQFKHIGNFSIQGHGFYPRTRQRKVVETRYGSTCDALSPSIQDDSALVGNKGLIVLPIVEYSEQSRTYTSTSYKVVVHQITFHSDTARIIDGTRTVNKITCFYSGQTTCIDGHQCTVVVHNELRKRTDTAESQQHKKKEKSDH